MSKKGKRRLNRERCALYTNQKYEELKRFLSSKVIEAKFLHTSVENICRNEDPKWLVFTIDGVHYRIKACAYAGHMDVRPFRYSCLLSHRRLIPWWTISVCYRFSSPLDVVEMVMIAYRLHWEYNKYETIEEMKELVLQNNVPYVCISIEQEDTGELLKLFVKKHNIKDDRFGMTYYFIQRLCEAFVRLVDDDWNEDY